MEIPSSFDKKGILINYWYSWKYNLWKALYLFDTFIYHLVSKAVCVGRQRCNMIHTTQKGGIKGRGKWERTLGWDRRIGHNFNCPCNLRGLLGFQTCVVRNSDCTLLKEMGRGGGETAIKAGCCTSCCGNASLLGANSLIWKSSQLEKGGWKGGRNGKGGQAVFWLQAACLCRLELNSGDIPKDFFKNALSPSTPSHLQPPIPLGQATWSTFALHGMLPLITTKGKLCHLCFSARQGC